MFRNVFIAFSLSLIPVSTPLAMEMDASQIMEKVGGARIYLRTPLGGEFPMNYRSNGTVDADGKAFGLGRFVKPKDRGRWWLRGNELCQKWTSWYDGRTFCFVLIDKGRGKLLWKRDDGATGRARLGGKL